MLQLNVWLVLILCARVEFGARLSFFCSLIYTLIALPLNSVFSSSLKEHSVVAFPWQPAFCVVVPIVVWICSRRRDRLQACHIFLPYLQMRSNITALANISRPSMVGLTFFAPPQRSKNRSIAICAGRSSDADSGPRHDGFHQPKVDLLRHLSGQSKSQSRICRYFQLVVSVQVRSILISQSLFMESPSMVTVRNSVIF